MRIGDVTRFDAPRYVHLPTLDAIGTGGRLVLFKNDAVELMLAHARQGHPNEVIGALIGFPAESLEDRRPVTYVAAVVPLAADATSVYVSMRLSNYPDLEAACRAANAIQVGYYHSHPGHGVFQSGTDSANFRTYHAQSYEVAVVVDHTRQTGGIENLDPSWFGVFVWAAEQTPIRSARQDVYALRRPLEVAHVDSSELSARLSHPAVDEDSTDSVEPRRRTLSRLLRRLRRLRSRVP